MKKLMVSLMGALVFVAGDASSTTKPNGCQMVIYLPPTVTGIQVYGSSGFGQCLYGEKNQYTGSYVRDQSRTIYVKSSPAGQATGLKLAWTLQKYGQKNPSYCFPLSGQEFQQANFNGVSGSTNNITASFYNNNEAHQQVFYTFQANTTQFQNPAAVLNADDGLQYYFSSCVPDTVNPDVVCYFSPTSPPGPCP